MKAIAKSTPYFSAYPLKVITESTTANPNLEPYLNALLNSQAKSVSRVKVFPMANPYPSEIEIITPVHYSRQKNADKIAATDCLGNYE